LDHRPESWEHEVWSQALSNTLGRTWSQLDDLGDPEALNYSSWVDPVGDGYGSISIIDGTPIQEANPQTPNQSGSYGIFSQFKLEKKATLDSSESSKERRREQNRKAYGNKFSCVFLFVRQQH